MPKLRISLPDGEIVTHDLEEDTITVGRLPDNTIQIDDASVSSHHARLTRDEGEIYQLEDLGSTNGTRINGQPATEGRLEGGEKVRFGKIECVYTTATQTEALPMPEMAEVAPARPAESSARPSNFTNASPFEKKQKKDNTTGKAVIAYAVVSILVFAGALATIFALKPPQ